MSQTLKITNGQLTDENGMEPPDGFTEDGHWFVSSVRSIGLRVMKVYFRPDPNHPLAYQSKLSDLTKVPDLPSYTPPSSTVVVISGTHGDNYIVMSDGSTIPLNVYVDADSTDKLDM
jgi:hypothetical protein